MKKGFLIILLLPIISCKVKNKPLIIKPLHTYTKIYLCEKADSCRIDYYYIKDFTSYANDSLILDSFVRKCIAPNYKNFSSYSIAFYQETEHINKSFRKTANDNVRSTDLIVTYCRENGIFINYLVDFSSSSSLIYYRRLDSLFNSPKL
jgi:hypothetical protein